jgi:hypothetical protein
MNFCALGWICFAICVLIRSSAAQNNLVPLVGCSHVRRSGETNEWWIAESRLAKLPQWHPTKQKSPPLSLEKAVRIAEKWIKHTEGGTEYEPTEITVRSLHPDENEFRYHYYYRITFPTRPFDEAVCVVLMDGSVLEPSRRN